MPPTPAYASIFVYGHIARIVGLDSVGDGFARYVADYWDHDNSDGDSIRGVLRDDAGQLLESMGDIINSPPVKALLLRMTESSPLGAADGPVIAGAVRLQSMAMHRLAKPTPYCVRLSDAVAAELTRLGFEAKA